AVEKCGYGHVCRQGLWPQSILSFLACHERSRGSTFAFLPGLAESLERAAVSALLPAYRGSAYGACHACRGPDSLGAPAAGLGAAIRVHSFFRRFRADCPDW